MVRGWVCLWLIAWPTAAAAAGSVPMTLDEAIARAVAQSPRIAAARARLAAEEARLAAVWAFAPAEVGFERRGVPDLIVAEPYEFQKIAIRQRFEFPTIYGLRSREHAGRVDAARRSVELEELAIVVEVKTAYVDVLRAHRGVELARENLRLSVGLLEKAELRFELGEEGRREMLWARLERNRAENAVVAAAARAAETGARLAALVADRNAALAGGIEPADPLAFHPVDLVAFGLDPAWLDGHPRLRAHDSRIAAAATGVTLASRSLLPEIGVGLFRQELRNVAGVWGVEVGFTIPLLSWNGRQARLSESRAQLSEAEAARDDDHLRLQADLRAALTAVQESDRQVRRFEGEILREAEEVFRLAEISYREGETSYVDLLLAQQALIGTRTEHLDALADHARAVARLELAAGRRIR